MPKLPSLNLNKKVEFPLQAKALETEEDTKDIAETQLDETPQDTQQDTDMTSEGGVAKRCVEPGISPQKKRTKVQPLPQGVSRVENKGEGNCLFLAIAQSIQSSGGAPEKTY